jgi:hypothetical protein
LATTTALRRGYRPKLPLDRTVRKAVLVVHLLGVGAWIGIDVIVAILVTTAWVSDDAGAAGLAYRALAEFTVTPMLVSALASLVTGVILGLGTPWGLVRYWWVAVKLGLTIAMCALIAFALRPGMAEVRGAGDQLAAGSDAALDPSMFFPPAVSLTALSLATVLSVAKPWGRIRSRRA